MRPGAFAYVDALGFKGIWTKGEPGNVLDNLSRLGEFAYAVAKNFDGGKVADLGFAFRVALLSDTICLGAQPNQPSKRNLKLALTVVCHAISHILTMGALSEPQLLYRGCVTCGEFHMTERYLIGPAVDRAAECGQQPFGPFVVVHPEADEYFVDLSSADGRPKRPIGLEFDVPVKCGGTLHCIALSPIAQAKGRLQRKKVSDRILDAMSGSDTEQVQRRQTTAMFLEHCHQRTEGG